MPITTKTINTMKATSVILLFAEFLLLSCRDPNSSEDFVPGIAVLRTDDDAEPVARLVLSIDHLGDKKDGTDRGRHHKQKSVRL